MPPNLNREKRLWKKGYKRVVCLDEVGRGCLAGPVVASAVVITTAKIKNQKPSFHLWKRGGRRERSSLRPSKIKNILREIRDSKKLTPKRREEFYKVLTKHPAIKWGLGRVSEKVIDRINILEATKLAMEKAIKNLNCKIDYLILDGKMKLNLPIPQKSIVKADEKVFSCAAASILAKVIRDRIMQRYHQKYPQYGFDKHKGYCTNQHRKALKKHGPCKIHRKSFKPISSLAKC